MNITPQLLSHEIIKELLGIHDSVEIKSPTLLAFTRTFADPLRYHFELTSVWNIGAWRLTELRRAREKEMLEQLKLAADQRKACVEAIANGIAKLIGLPMKESNEMALLILKHRNEPMAQYFGTTTVGVPDLEQSYLVYGERGNYYDLR